jgi:ABC-2 type transport system ATP-binding protein
MTAIVAEGISKKFRLSQSRTSLKDRFFRRDGQGDRQDFWALHPLDLTINQGETVGILGHNGSGKSTTLKCIAGILKPTTGLIRVRGRVASLLELGAGFHPDLTGRENVFINASFLGIPKNEIERRFDDIVAFAELDSFIDQQVKYYSSGMFVRLGFAVAINVEPDVLLVDEVLSVGDEAFQQKCMDRVEQIQREGRTILFVTHGADQVRRICNRGLVLDHGHLVADAEPAEAIRVFREHLHGHLSEQPADAEHHVDDSAVSIVSVNFEHPANPEEAHLVSGDPLRLVVELDAHEPLDDAVLGIQIRNVRGDSIYLVDTTMLRQPLPRLTGRTRVSFEFPQIPLLDGDYPVSLRLRNSTGATLALRENVDQLSVLYRGKAEGLVLLEPRLDITPL